MIDAESDLALASNAEVMISFSRDRNGVHVLVAEQSLPLPRADVFPFFADARNLNKLTPPSLRFQILTPDSELQALCDGQRLDYRIRVRGLPMRWRTRIAAWDPPDSFADEQLQGPYSLWHHTHAFAKVLGPDGEEWTQMVDTVRYLPPLGPILGGLANCLFVRRELRMIFAFRREALVNRFGDPNATTRSKPSAGLQGSMRRSESGARSVPIRARG